MGGVKQGQPRGAEGAHAGCPTRWPRPSTSGCTAHERWDPDAPLGGTTPAGGSRGSPTAPTRSTRSRSCRWPPSTWPGPRRVLDVGCGDGQVARLARAGGAELVVGVDPTWNQIRVAAERGGGPAYARAGAAGAALRRRPRSTPWWRASCSSTSATSTPPSPRWPGCCVPGGRVRSSSSTTRCSRRPNSGWIDDQILDPPEQYWRIGPYLVEDETIEEVEKGVFIPFIHRPLSRYVNALAGQRPAARAHGRAGPAARLPRPGRRVPGGGHHPPAAAPAGPQAGIGRATAGLGGPVPVERAAGTLGSVTDIVVITGLSGAGRTSAAADLEDQGWYVVDNLPTSLVRTIVELASVPGSGIDRLALVGGHQPAPGRDPRGHRGGCGRAGHRVRIVFLEAATPELVQALRQHAPPPPAGRRTPRCWRPSPASASCWSRSRPWPTSSSTRPTSPSTS